MFKVNNKYIKSTSLALSWLLHCELWTYFPPFSSFSNFNFEHVIVNWEYMQHF